MFCLASLVAISNEGMIFIAKACYLYHVKELENNHLHFLTGFWFVLKLGTFSYVNPTHKAIFNIQSVSRLWKLALKNQLFYISSIEMLVHTATA